MRTTEALTLQLKEITDRSRRIETRLCRICEHLGVDLAPGNTTAQQAYSTPEEQVYHAHMRIRRIETSLHQLRDHLGMPPYEAAKKIPVSSGGVIDAPGLDITLAAIRGALLSASKFEESVPFYIHINGKEVADIIFTGKA